MPPPAENQGKKQSGRQVIMTFKEFTYSVNVVMRLTVEEIDKIIKIGEKHYDSHCRKEATTGFIRGWKTQLEFYRASRIISDVSDTITINFDQADTVCKILEMDLEHTFTIDEIAAWHDILKMINTETRRIYELNKNLPPYGWTADEQKNITNLVQLVTINAIDTPSTIDYDFVKTAFRKMALTQMQQKG